MNDIFVASKHKEKMQETAFAPKHIPVLSYSEDNSKDMNSFSAFSQNPKGVTFQTQKDNEVIILFLRSHFITNISWIVVSLVLIILPIIILAFLPTFGIDLHTLPQTIRFTTIYTLFYYLTVFSYIFISFLHWFYNVFMVTSERVVDIDYSEIVVHNIAVTNLNHIEDVNYTQSGFIPTFFNYGDVFVQTAGNERNFEALSVPKPREATHIIGDLIEKGH